VQDGRLTNLHAVQDVTDPRTVAFQAFQRAQQPNAAAISAPVLSQHVADRRFTWINRFNRKGFVANLPPTVGHDRVEIATNMVGGCHLPIVMSWRLATRALGSVGPAPRFSGVAPR
jgi:hypothetical protein